MCCSPDRALFVTKTSLSIIDADAKPPGLSIAYDRVEGYLGPSYENGAVPPVFASVKSDGKVFNPRIKQKYATGNAAVIVAGGEPQVETMPLSGKKRVMFFGTSTTTGIKIGFTQNLPDSFLFGFRRKEISYIPIESTPKLDDDGSKVLDAQGNPIMIDRYSSSLAVIDTAAEVSSDIPQNKDAGLKNSQVFATGRAAEAFAPSVAVSFQKEAQDAFGAYRKAVLDQEIAGGAVIVCYPGVRILDRPKVWRDADKMGLFHDMPNEEKTIDILMKAFGEVVDENGNIKDADRLARIDRVYTTSIYSAEGFDPARLKLLEIHEETVCSLSKENQK
jgi:hypothetical protein